MSDALSRESLTSLWQAVNAVTPSAIVGLARHLDDGRIEMPWVCGSGFGAFVSETVDVPPALRPALAGIGHHESLGGAAQTAIEWQAAFAGARRLWSIPIQGCDPAARLWIG